NLVWSNQPRAYWTEGIGALAFYPLARTLELKGTFGNVVDDAIAGNVRKRLRFFHILSGLANDHPKLDLPVRLFRSARDHDIIVGTADGRCCLHKNNRLDRQGHSGFLGMIGIVQANAYE